MQSFKLISDKLIEPAEYVHETFLSRAYELHDPYIKQIQENLDTTIIIPRPNHGDAHSIRVPDYRTGNNE